ncbi:hypothetical protein [uncultured Maribacter sp.]|uniref:hypothetical protein n=1 Tax=uncultured Maribacter sp. TaxID=431308 RepID=UPI0026180A78|nr:hypothetical protein [uncultured Maribacter sp.]
MPLEGKAVSTHIELMFESFIFQTEDMIEQHNILNKASELIDYCNISKTLGDNFGIINVVNLRKVSGNFVLEEF